MRKLFLVKLLLTVTVLFVFFSNFNYVEASLLSDMRAQIDSFEIEGQKVNVDTENVVEPFVELARLLTTTGAGVLVAVTTYMGIKYLTSGPEAQAKLKVQLIGLVVSGFVIFGAYFIWKVVLTFSNSL